MQPIRQLVLNDGPDGEPDRKALVACPFPEGLHVIVPAKDAERSIVGTLEYLAWIGLKSYQIHVIVNNTTDETAKVAKSTGLARVWEQDEIFEQNIDLVASLEEWGISRSRLRGKGTAMFASLLVLRKLDLKDRDPVLFLDAELTNLFWIDPVSRMLLGWHEFGGASGGVQIIKLAASEQIDNWFHPFLAANPRYGNLAAMRWPLCGQALVPWEVLRSARMATGYGIEMAMLMSIADRFEVPQALGEVRPNGSIADDYVHTPKNQQGRFRMLFQIQMLLSACTEHGITGMNKEQVKAYNATRTATYWTVGEQFTGPPNELTDVPLDGILPSLEELLEAR